jgi:membrane-bound lytic murein transglycosylase B
MQSTIRLLAATVLLTGLCFIAGPAMAATCQDPGRFGAFMASMKTEATAQGISPSAIGVLDGVSYDPGIISKDHGQGVFRQSFAQFPGA